MPEEQKRKAQTGQKLNVGQRLKARRQQLRLSLAQVEIDTKIRGKFLNALESGDYSSLPNDIYSRGFVQHYANHLGLDGNEVAAAYARERGGVAKGETRRPQMERPKRFVFTGQVVAVLGGLVLAAAVVGYLLWQFSALAAPPQLNVTSPAGDEALTGGVVDVSGSTTPGADVSVNDSPVLTDTDGNFSEKVALQNGVNAIHIVSKSKLGKTTTVTRNVLATLPKLDAAQVITPSPFSGIEVKLVARRTAALSVSVDNGDQVDQLVMPGWEKLYKGSSKVIVSTSDAGAIEVYISNSTVGNKYVGIMGNDGEVRKNQEFDTDSVFK